MAELTTTVSAVSTAALVISELTAMTTKCTAAECEETSDSDAFNVPPSRRNRDNSAIAGRQEHVPKKPKT